MTVIDMHSHFFPESWPDLAQRFGTPDWPWMKQLGDGKAMVMVGDREFRPVTAACWDVDVRLADMDRDGIDIELLCATPVLFAYQRKPEEALACAELFNDAALELCARGQGRLKALAQVPLQDTDLACRTIERAMAAGHLGVQIGNHVGDRDLDDAASSLGSMISEMYGGNQGVGSCWCEPLPLVRYESIVPAR